MDLKSSEVSEIFDKILQEDLILNNASVALLQEFATLWTNAAIREDAFCQFFQNWIKKLQLLQQQKSLNNGTCIVTIFIIEACLNSPDLDQNSQCYSLVSQNFVQFHKSIVSACMTNVNEITSSNDAVIAFFRLHDSLSRRPEGVELIRKYNLWKPLLLFYFQSNRFNWFIKNSITEYICNLIKAELPNEVISLLEVLNTSIHSIKSTIENSHPLCDGILFRSLRIVYHILSHCLTKSMNVDSLRLISKCCHPLESYIRHLLILSKDETIVCNSLKIFILLRVFLINVEDVKNEDEIFRRLVSTTYELLSENEKFNQYMPEVFNSCTKFEDRKIRSKLHLCCAYLQMRTITEYLTQMDIVSSEWSDSDLVLPESEIFASFIELYLKQLCKQNQTAMIATNILKDFQNEDIMVDKDTRVYVIRSFRNILKLFSDEKLTLSHELNNFLLNIIHAVSNLISKEEELSEYETVFFSDFLRTLMQITLRDRQHSVIVRLSVLKSCRHILRKVGKISVENAQFLGNAIVQGLDDSCWEVRDTTLEILIEILTISNINEQESIFLNLEISKSLLKRLQDEESFVRSTAYMVLTVLVSLKNGNLWTINFDYHALLEETVRNFQNETEGNVREKMIEFIIEGWRSFEISDSLLLKTIYEVIYEASVNDLHPEVRRNGMAFWKSLVEGLNNHRAGPNIEETVDFLQKLSSVGCFQAISCGIEDEYDREVIKNALETLRILKSFDLSVTNFCEVGSKNLQVSPDEFLLNKLTPISFSKSDVMNVRQFISRYVTSTDVGYSILENSTRNYEVDLKNLLKCFINADLEGSEINQKDCY